MSDIVPRYLTCYDIQCVSSSGAVLREERTCFSDDTPATMAREQLLTKIIIVYKLEKCDRIKVIRRKIPIELVDEG